MLTAKQARKLANETAKTKDLFNFDWEMGIILEAAKFEAKTSTYLPVPYNEAVFKELKKHLTKAGYKYSITKDNSLLIKW